MNVVNCSTRLPTIPGPYAVLTKHANGYHRAHERGITWEGRWVGAPEGETVVSWVDTAPPVTVIPPTNVSALPTEPEAYTLVLNGYDATSKIGLIKLVREMTGLGLGEAKALVEACGVAGGSKTLKTMPAADAKIARDKLAAAGGKVALVAE